MSQFIPLFTYLFVMAVTPGPNNLMLAVSGVNFGFRRSLPHMLGICFGNAVQTILCASLFAVVGNWIASARSWLAVIGCLYLFWLAWKIARAGAANEDEGMKPLTFTEGALFQAVNPKAWVMVLNAVILFMPRSPTWWAAAGLAGAGVIVGFPSIAIWAAGGEKLRLLMKRPVTLRIFNFTMAALLAGTALWLLVDELHGQ